MNSKPQIVTERLKVSKSNLEAWILAGLSSIAKGKLDADDEVLSLRLDGVSLKDIVEVEIVKDKDKGVRILKFGT